MAKRARRTSKKQMAAPPVAIPSIVVDPFGPTKQRHIVKSKIVTSEFLLDDGTKLLVTPIVSDVRRAVDQFNLNGDPLYFLTMGQTVKTRAPKKLLRKVSRAGRRKKKRL